jgi:hypothetical protein
MTRILNVCLVGTPGGPTVRVMCLADLFPYLTAVSLVHHIYTSCKPYGKSERAHCIPCVVTLSHHSEDRRLAPVVFPARVFHVKIVSRVQSCFRIIS